MRTRGEFTKIMYDLFDSPNFFDIKRIRIWGHKNGGCYVAIYEKYGGGILCRKVPYHYSDVDWWFYRQFRPDRAGGGLNITRGVYMSDMRKRRNETWR